VLERLRSFICEREGLKHDVGGFVWDGGVEIGSLVELLALECFWVRVCHSVVLILRWQYCTLRSGSWINQDTSSFAFWTA
jgi:hypothetical protein